MTKRKLPTHGGPRKGAGRKPDDPDNPRVPWTGRLATTTVATLKRHATPEKSQAKIVDEAVEKWAP